MNDGFKNVTEKKLPARLPWRKENREKSVRISDKIDKLLRNFPSSEQICFLFHVYLLPHLLFVEGISPHTKCMTEILISQMLLNSTTKNKQKSTGKHHRIKVLLLSPELKTLYLQSMVSDPFSL